MRSLFAVGFLLCVATSAFRLVLPHDQLLRSERSSGGDSSCPVFACVAEGGGCNPADFTNQIPFCIAGGTCNPNNVCPSLLQSGDACTPGDNDMCTFGLTCAPGSNTCVSQFSIRENGAACSSNAQCSYTNSSGMYGLCQSGACYGLPIGAACDKSFDQCTNAFCNGQNVCTKLLASGSSCYSSDSCVASDICSSGHCKPYGSTPYNMKCTETGACHDGYYCNSKSQTCRKGFAVGKFCKTNADCPKDAECGCDYSHDYKTCLNPEANPKGTTAALKALAQCAASHNCIGEDFNCISANCPNAYCSYRSIAKSEFASGPGCVNSYFRAHFDDVLPPIASCNN